MISLVCQKLPGQASYYSKYRTQTRLDYPTILPAIINFMAFRKKIGKLPQPKINHSINLKIIWFWSYCNMNTKGVKTVVWWGPHWPSFPLSLYLYLYYIKNIWKQTYYFQFFVGGDSLQLKLWSHGMLAIPCLLEELSGNCQMSHIKWNLFQVMQIIFHFCIFSLRGVVG